MNTHISNQYTLMQGKLANREQGLGFALGQSGITSPNIK